MAESDEDMGRDELKARRKKDRQSLKGDDSDGHEDSYWKNEKKREKTRKEKRERERERDSEKESGEITDDTADEDGKEKGNSREGKIKDWQREKFITKEIRDRDDQAAEDIDSERKGSKTRESFDNGSVDVGMRQRPSDKQAHSYDEMELPPFAEVLEKSENRDKLEEEDMDIDEDDENSDFKGRNEREDEMGKVQSGVKEKNLDGSWQDERNEGDKIAAHDHREGSKYVKEYTDAVSENIHANRDRRSLSQTKRSADEGDSKGRDKRPERLEEFADRERQFSGSKKMMALKSSSVEISDKEREGGEGKSDKEKVKDQKRKSRVGKRDESSVEESSSSSTEDETGASSKRVNEVVQMKKRREAEKKQEKERRVLSRSNREKSASSEDENVAKQRYE